MHENDSDDDGNLTGNTATGAVEPAAVTNEKQAEEAATVADAAPGNGTADSSDSDAASLAGPAHDMAAVIYAAHRAAGQPIPPTLDTGEPAELVDTAGRSDHPNTPGEAPSTNAQYQRRVRTAPVRLGEGDAHSSLGGTPDDARIRAGVALAVRTAEPASATVDVMAKEMEALFVSGASTWEAAPDIDAALYRKMGDDLLRHKKGNGSGAILGFPDAAWPWASTGAAMAAREVEPNNDKMTLARARMQPDWPEFDISTRQKVTRCGRTARWSW